MGYGITKLQSYGDVNWIGSSLQFKALNFEINISRFRKKYAFFLCLESNMIKL
jgi:hypothetical protein